MKGQETCSQTHSQRQGGFQLGSSFMQQSSVVQASLIQN